MSQSNEFYFWNLVEDNNGKIQGFFSYLLRYVRLSLFLSLNEPTNLPFPCINLNGDSLSIFNFGSCLPTLALFEQRSSILVISNKLFAILSSIQTLYCFTSYSIHEWTVRTSSNLLYVVSIKTVFLESFFGE